MIAKAVAVFRATAMGNKKAFAFLSDADLLLKSGDILFSEDGVKFYAVQTGGMSMSACGDLVEAAMSFTSPRQDVSGRLLYHSKAGVVVYDDEFYVKQDGDEFDIELIPLPTARRPEYLFEKGDGSFIYVSADKYNYEYESFRLFVGDGKTMQEIPVLEVSRYRDGGTTYVRTEEGILFSPTPFNAESPPSWGHDVAEEKLTRLEPRDCDIVETPDGQVFITTH